MKDPDTPFNHLPKTLTFPQDDSNTAVLFKLLSSWYNVYGSEEVISEKGMRTLLALFKSLELIQPHNHQTLIANQLAFMGINPLTQRVIVPVADGIQLIEIDEILYIRSKNTSSFRGTELFLTHGKPIDCTKTLKSIESNVFSTLPFLQVHRSYIVNAQRIRAYHPEQEFVYLETASFSKKVPLNHFITKLSAPEQLKPIPVGKTYRPALEQFLHSYPSL